MASTSTSTSTSTSASILTLTLTSTIPTTSSSSSPSSSPSSSTPSATNFLSLHLEIRLTIYALLLHLPTPKHFHSTTQTPTYISPNLLLANRQINHEATPLLYSSNIFIAHPSPLTSFPRLRSWYSSLREAKALVPRIRRFHIQVRLDCDLTYDRSAAAKAFSGIDELSIDLVQSMFMGVGCDNLRTFEDVGGMRKVSIVGSTMGFRDYVEWLKDTMMSEPGSHVPEFEPSEEFLRWNPCADSAISKQ